MANTVDARELAAEIFSEAWKKAAAQGIASELVASTTLSAALASLVKTHGCEAAVRMTDRLLEAVRAGRFDHAHAPVDRLR